MDISFRSLGPCEDCKRIRICGDFVVNGHKKISRKGKK
jgi:hypothetical protein